MISALSAQDASEAVRDGRREAPTHLLLGLVGRQVNRQEAANRNETKDGRERVKRRNQGGPVVSLANSTSTHQV
jgi:hypothetical protein